jgi:arylsulfatase A-like enzyme
MKVLVLNAPALHAGYLGCYGNEWVETPHLDQLAAEGVVFEQHFADNPGAEGNGRPCWTGRYHFPLPGSDDQPPQRENLSLTAVLSGGGVQVFPVRASPKRAERESVFQAGFAELHRLAGHDRWLLWVDLPPLVFPWPVPEEFLDLYFVEGPEQEAEPLTPWPDPPQGPLDPADDTALEQLQNTYAAAVSHLDADIGRLLGVIEKDGLKEDLLVCVTADRGLALGEHGVVGECRPWLHEEVVHVPLIVRLPREEEACRRVLALTQPVDLFPTLLEAFELPVPPIVQGRSLWPLLRGQAEQIRAYACGGLRISDGVEWALRTPEWAFILPVSSAAEDRSYLPQLFVKPDDRWEVNNVLQHHLDLSDHFEHTLRGFVAATQRPGPLEPPPLLDFEALTPSAPDNSTHDSPNPGGSL